MIISNIEEPMPVMTVSDTSDRTASDASSIWQKLRHGTAMVNSLQLHYVEGGKGRPLLLIPGWPQSWYAWRLVMPRLIAAGRRVIAVDPRGMGDSDRPAHGYDLTTVAADMHCLAETLSLPSDGPIDVAGHDVGAWIAYAFASDWPSDVRRVAVLDALVPGLSAPRMDLDVREGNLRSWHFPFNQLDDLPEALLVGREKTFLTWLFRAKSVRSWAFTAADIDEYARQMAAPGAIRAATAYYKAAFSAEGTAANRARAARPLDVPLLVLGAERGLGQTMVEALAPLARDVSGRTVPGCGHYMPEECPEEIAADLLAFFEPMSAHMERVS
jgi:pimeloyl-ACP methyl ester carboxylesterase